MVDPALKLDRGTAVNQIESFYTRMYDQHKVKPSQFDLIDIDLTSGVTNEIKTETD